MRPTRASATIAIMTTRTARWRVSMHRPRQERQPRHEEHDQEQRRHREGERRSQPHEHQHDHHGREQELRLPREQDDETPRAVCDRHPQRSLAHLRRRGPARCAACRRGRLLGARRPGAAATGLRSSRTGPRGGRLALALRHRHSLTGIRLGSARREDPLDRRRTARRRQNGGHVGDLAVPVRRGRREHGRGGARPVSRGAGPLQSASSVARSAGPWTTQGSGSSRPGGSPWGRTGVRCRRTRSR